MKALDSPPRKCLSSNILYSFKGFMNSLKFACKLKVKYP